MLTTDVADGVQQLTRGAVNCHLIEDESGLAPATALDSVGRIAGSRVRIVLLGHGGPWTGDLVVLAARDRPQVIDYLTVKRPCCGRSDFW